MLRAGWITEHVATPEAGAATGVALGKGAGVSRRQRITYELTPAGDERFAKLMSDAGPASWEDDNFDVRFAFFGRTDREIRLRILEGRRARLEERLARFQQEMSASRSAQRKNSYAAELQRHGMESVQREVRWLSDLIAAERSGGQLSKPTDNN
jgi:DNA-binding PadR family transcriptional regulator